MSALLRFAVFLLISLSFAFDVSSFSVTSMQAPATNLLIGLEASRTARGHLYAMSTYGGANRKQRKDTKCSDSYRTMVWFGFVILLLKFCFYRYRYFLSFITYCCFWLSWFCCWCWQFPLTDFQCPVNFSVLLHQRAGWHKTSLVLREVFWFPMQEMCCYRECLSRWFL